MASRKRNVDAESAFGSASLSDYPGVGSRPSKTNCTTDDTEPETSVFDSEESWWRRKNEIVDRFVEERSRRAVRPVSVRGGTKLRDEAATEKGKHDDRYRSKTWSAVLNEFLKWYNGYRDAQLVFHSPEGEEVRGQMRNSHMPEYGDKYYARLKAFERQIVKEYEDPHSVMITLSGSSENANGGWRCPADHLRDVVESWRPSRGRGVYHTLRYVLDGKDWEYAIVLEKHQSGYGHVHVAVFVDGIVEKEEFHSVIDAHLQKCDIAGWKAHDYNNADSENRPISVNRIDPKTDDVDSISNLGSYIGEYIGSYGKELFDRGLDELMFRAAVWATGTQIVRFSTGANEMIERDRSSHRRDRSETKVRPNSACEPAIHGRGEFDVFPFEIENPGWDFIGVSRGIGDGGQVFKVLQSKIVWREIEDASKTDPPKIVTTDGPKSRSRD